VLLVVSGRARPPITIPPHRVPTTRGDLSTEGSHLRTDRSNKSLETQAPRGTLNTERWEEVVEAAAKVFAEKGYRAATLRDIAAELGMLKGSLYYYIESKEDLLYEILKRAHAGGIKRMRADPQYWEGSPSERLTHFIRTYMSRLDEIPPTLVISESDLGELEGERRAEVLRLRRAIFDVPLAAVAEGVRRGDFAGDTDPYVATATLFRILNSTVFWFRAERHLDWERVTDWYVVFILRGIGYQPEAGWLQVPDP
jgi:AcrR family transcriptional regulator